jgi:hypothetical protein
MILAEELIAPGGPSGPVWAFLTAITVGIMGIIAQQIAARRAAIEAKTEARKAAFNSAEANRNTTNLSNGFAADVNAKLNDIIHRQERLDENLNKHIEWHLNKGVK